MSVEYCVVRVTSHTFGQLQQQPEILQDLIDEFYSTSGEASQAKGYIDSHNAITDSLVIAPPIVRTLYIDEFTTWLLVDFMEEDSPFFVALAGWSRAHLLESVSYGYGDIFYYSPEDAKPIAASLKDYATELLEARFREQAEDFRIASAGYLKDDQAILAYQRTFANLLRRFYNEAAQDGDFVLLLTV
jgi:hypothetical protein